MIAIIDENGRLHWQYRHNPKRPNLWLYRRVGHLYSSEREAVAASYNIPSPTVRLSNWINWKIEQSISSRKPQAISDEWYIYVWGGPSFLFD